MSIVSFYNHILSAASLTSDVEGKVSVVLEGLSRPFTIEGKRVMLPTHEVMQMVDKSNIRPFHPLNENTLSGESVVMQKFRDAVNLTLNLRLKKLVSALISLAASPAQHQALKPEHFSLMGVLKNADEKTFEDWNNLRKAMTDGDTDKCFVHIFLKKGADVNGRKYRRGAVVSFPLYEELLKAIGNETTKGNSHVFGVKLRKKDLAALKELMEAIFPGVAEKNSYSRGGPSVIAPSLDALLRAVKDLAGQINAVVETFEGVSDVSDLRYSDEWVEEAENLDTFEAELRLLPMQVGNEGTTGREAGGSVQAPAQQQVVSTPGTVSMSQIMPTVQSPAFNAVPAPSVVPQATPMGAAAGTVSMQDLMATNPALQAVGFALPGMPNYGYPAMNMFGMQQPTGAAALRAQAPSWANPAAQFVNRGF